MTTSQILKIFAARKLCINSHKNFGMKLQQDHQNPYVFLKSKQNVFNRTEIRK